MSGGAYPFLVRTPARSLTRRHRSAAAIVTMLSYGHQIAPEGDAYVTLADQALTGLAQAGLFGTYIVDYLPFRESLQPPARGGIYSRPLIRSETRSGLGAGSDLQEASARMEESEPSNGEHAL